MANGRHMEEERPKAISTRENIRSRRFSPSRLAKIWIPLLLLILTILLLATLAFVVLTVIGIKF